MLKSLSLFTFLVFLIQISQATEKYDYIVLGSGSSGSVIAARLRQDPTLKVLLLERGYDVSNDPTTAVPVANSVISPYDLTLLPVEHLHSHEPLLSRGETPTFVPWALGGGPAVSGSFWGRGDPSNYDEWADLVGDSSLTYNNLLSYFKKTENVNMDDSDSSDRGRTGPIDVTFLSHNDTDVLPLAQLQSATFGVELGTDYATSNGLEGIWPMQRSLLRDGICGYLTGPCVRQSSYDAYVKPYLSTASNLEVIPNANVVNINLKSNGNSIKAVGVNYLHKNKVVTVKAKKEVIVSLGTINS